MISAAYCRAMAGYNAWQNRSLYAAADDLDEAARRAGRGAFFGSIHGTLSHLLWADHMWMSRFAGWPKPGIGVSDSAGFVADWGTLAAAREKADAAILDWAGRLTQADTEGGLTWHSGAANREVTRPRAVCFVHFFNHQTHHRGQAHAMLTAAGATPEASDLFMMPELEV